MAKNQLTAKAASPADSSPTDLVGVVADLGLTFLWRGKQIDLHPGIPTFLERAQVDYLEGVRGTGVRRMGDPSAPTQTTPFTPHITPKYRPSPKVIPALGPDHQAIAAEEDGGFVWHGHLIQLRAGEPIVLDRDQIEHLEKSGIPFRRVS
jgi:hypothetical protein